MAEQNKPSIPDTPPIANSHSFPSLNQHNQHRKPPLPGDGTILAGRMDVRLPVARY